MCFRWQRKTHSFENVLVWTRPKTSPPNSRSNLSHCVMIWSKLKADSDCELKIPVQFRCSFVIELVKKKQRRTANPGRQKQSILTFDVRSLFCRVKCNKFGENFHPSFSVDFELATIFRLVTVKMRKIQMILQAELLLIEVFPEQSIICTSLWIHTEYSEDQLKGINWTYKFSSFFSVQTVKYSSQKASTSYFIISTGHGKIVSKK